MSGTVPAIIFGTENQYYWPVIDDSFTDQRFPERGISSWGPSVEDLDAGQSDEAQCFDMSNKLGWKGMTLTADGITGNPYLDTDKVKAFLALINWCAWDPMDL